MLTSNARVVDSKIAMNNTIETSTYGIKSIGVLVSANMVDENNNDPFSFDAVLDCPLVL